MPISQANRASATSSRRACREGREAASEKAATTSHEGGGQSARPAILLVYSLVFFMQCSRSLYFIVIPWLALRMTGEFATVGQVLVWWPLLTVTAGPVMGAVVDRFNRANLVMFGEYLRSIGLMGLVLNTWARAADESGLAALHVTAFVASFGSLLSVPATQALLQTVGGRSLNRVVATGLSINQTAHILGAALGGVAIALVGIEASISMVAGLSIVAVGFAARLRTSGTVPTSRESSSYTQSIAGGFRFILRDRLLLIGCLAIAAVWSADQMTLALLAGFTRLELGLGAVEFGWLEAVWGVGAIIGSLSLVRASSRFIDGFWIRLGPLLLAAAVAAFSMAQGLWSALLLYSIFGATFAANRAAYDAYILKTVDRGMIGRVRANIQTLIGAVSILVYLSPGLYAGLSVRTAYLGFSAALAAVACMLLIWRRRIRSVGNGHAAPQEISTQSALPSTRAALATGRPEHTMGPQEGPVRSATPPTRNQ